MWQNISKRQIVFVVSVIAILGSLFAYSVVTENRKSQTVSDTEFNFVGFQVYIDGKLQSFSSGKYMNTVPCVVTSDLSDAEDRIFLTQGVGDVAYIRSAGATWEDLFAAMKYELPETDLKTFFLDGARSPELLSRIPSDRESAIFYFGLLSEEKEEEILDNAVTAKRISAVAKSAISCY